MCLDCQRQQIMIISIDNISFGISSCNTVINGYKIIQVTFILALSYIMITLIHHIEFPKILTNLLMLRHPPPPPPPLNKPVFHQDTLLHGFDCLSIPGEVKVVNLNGRPKSSRKLSAELHFDFVVENLVVLQDSVLAFHKHGMQGRSFRTNEVSVIQLSLLPSISPNSS